MRMFIPTGGSASILLGRDGGPVFFDLRLDNPNGIFFPDNSGLAKGHYPINRPFSVAINVNIGANPSTEVTLLGEATGNFKVPGKPQNTGGPGVFSGLFFQSDIRKGASSFLVNDVSVIFTP